jgi:hypothetical protein
MKVVGPETLQNWGRVNFNPKHCCFNIAIIKIIVIHHQRNMDMELLDTHDIALYQKDTSSESFVFGIAALHFLD